MTAAPPTFSPAPPPPGPEARRAAAMVWLLGLLEVFACSCCVVSLFYLAGLDAATLEAAGRQYDMPPQTTQQVQQVAGAMAILTIALGLLPGLAYLLLGFGVRQRKVMAINTCLLLAITQGIVLGVLLLSQIIFAIGALNPVQATMTVFTHGTPLALIVYVIRLLLPLRSGVGVQDADLETDPWNQVP